MLRRQFPHLVCKTATYVFRTRHVILCAMVGLALASSTALSAAHAASCTISATGPFLYAGLVIPEAEVQCESALNRIRIEGVLEMDGVQVGAARRDCRKTANCQLSPDLRAADQPGDQVWCVQVSATVGGKGNVGSATSCATH